VICVSLCVTVDEAGRIYSAGKRDDSVARAVHACANVLVARARASRQLAGSRSTARPPQQVAAAARPRAGSQHARAHIYMFEVNGEECAQYGYVDVVSSGKRARCVRTRADGLAGAVVAALNYAYLYFVGVRRTSLIRLTKDVFALLS
jgi:hypothetical protein